MGNVSSHFLSISGFGLIVYNFLAVRPEPILNTAATMQIDEALAVPT